MATAAVALLGTNAATAQDGTISRAVHSEWGIRVSAIDPVEKFATTITVYESAEAADDAFGILRGETSERTPPPNPYTHRATRPSSPDF